MDISLDRFSKVSLADQVRDGIAAAIHEGRLLPGSRLPSWNDLASQLGIARGTVRVAYERLSDELLVVSSGSAGTRVVGTLPIAAKSPTCPESSPMPGLFRDFNSSVIMFQMGIPAEDEFPFKTWSRIVTNTSKAIALSPARFPDPRGEFELRQEIAAYVAIARRISCTPSQVIVTTGYGSGLGLATRILKLEGRKAWVENPGYPVTRSVLAFAGISPVPVAVDAEGMNVDSAILENPDAALAIVTPGQQAPLGMTMSAQRRSTLLAWASDNDAWIIEDDYLGELQLSGRAAPALAASDFGGRVIHVGTFSKTISPTLRLGYIIVPPGLERQFGEGAASFAPAPSPFVQSAIAEFIRGSHYLRHLRRMKRLYVARRDLLLDHFSQSRIAAVADLEVAGLAIIVRLRDADDVAIAEEARKKGLAASPISSWYVNGENVRPGLLLSITNYVPRRSNPCDILTDIIEIRHRNRLSASSVQSLS